MQTNPLINHIAQQRIFACEATQIRAAINASVFDDVDIDDFYDLRKKPEIIEGVGHIHIKSMLTNGAPKIYEKLGIVTSYDTIKTEIEGAMMAGAGAIVLHINSGGGSVNGAFELARWISALEIPTASVVTSCACSAAYMLASATNRIEATETAIVGNIGAIIAWVDYSAWQRAMGIEEKAITNEGATLKSTFHLEPNAEQLAFLQDTTNKMGEKFKAFVSERRPDLDPEVFRAGWYAGESAFALGLIDEILTPS
jgi:ClpP class serine protease